MSIQLEAAPRAGTPLRMDTFLVKEHAAVFKAANSYDIHDPESGEVVMECREEQLSFLTKTLRFTDYKRMTPFDVQIRTRDGKMVAQVKRGFSFFLSKVDVLDGDGTLLGGFKQKLFSVGGAFDVLDAGGQVVCTLKGKVTGWDFRFLAPGGAELASVSKKWAGMGKELFTSADNYVLNISPSVPSDSPVRKLILGAVMCIDLVLKE